MRRCEGTWACRRAPAPPVAVASACIDDHLHARLRIQRQQHGLPHGPRLPQGVTDEGVCTAEALYFFLKALVAHGKLAGARGSGEHHAYDDLLWYFVFQHQVGFGV